MVNTRTNIYQFPIVFGKASEIQTFYTKYEFTLHVVIEFTDFTEVPFGWVKRIGFETTFTVITSTGPSAAIALARLMPRFVCITRLRPWNSDLELTQ